MHPFATFFKALALLSAVKSTAADVDRDLLAKIPELADAEAQILRLLSDDDEETLAPNTDRLAGAKCKEDSQCGGPLECRSWGFGKRCLPTKECLSSKYQAVVNAHNLTTYHEHFMQQAHLSIAADEGGSMGWRDTLRMSYRNVYGGFFRELNQVAVTCGVLQEGDLEATPKTSSGVANVDGFHIEAGSLIDASYTDIFWMSGTTSGSEVRQFCRVCVGSELGLGVELSGFNFFVTSGGADAIPCASVMFDVDIGAVAGIGLEAGIGFNGAFRWGSTAALPGGNIATTASVGLGLLGCNFCGTSLFNTTTLP